MIDARHIQKTYPDFQLDLSLQVNPGTITGLIGLNGSGKTTFFKLLLGLLHESGGQIQLLDKDVDQLTPADKTRIGVVMADGFFPGLLQIRDLPPILKALYPDFDESFYLEHLNKAGISERKQLKECSTGMLAKVKILTALAVRPEILLLDEPTAGLDVLARREILDLIRQFMLEENHTVLISSHNSQDLETLCDDFYFIHQGQVILHEEIDALQSRYGILKGSREQLNALDPQLILAVEPTAYGVRALTTNRFQVLKDHPDFVVEPGNIDDLIALMIQGERV